MSTNSRLRHRGRGVRGDFVFEVYKFVVEEMQVIVLN